MLDVSRSDKQTNKQTTQTDRKMKMHQIVRTRRSALAWFGINITHQKVTASVLINCINIDICIIISANFSINGFTKFWQILL